MRSFKFYLIIVALLSIQVGTIAQVIQKTVALAPLGYSESTCDKDNLPRLYNYLLNNMQNTQRIVVLDRMYGNEIISIEKKLNQGVDFVESKVVDQGKQKGAQFILFIYVNSAKPFELLKETTNKETKEKTSEVVGYDCDLSLFARVINVESGQVVASQIITPSGNQTLGDLVYSTSVTNKSGGGLFAKKAATPQEAITKKMNDLEPYIRKFIDEIFPIELYISKVNLAPKNPQKPDGSKEQQVIIIGGKSTGFKDGDELIVKEIVQIEIGDKKYNDEVPIGKIKVIRTSQDLITCRVTDGEEIVLTKYNEKPKSLKVVYIPKKSNIFGK